MKGLTPLGQFCWVVVIYSWVWLRFRPTVFVVHPDLLEVVWPLRRCQIRTESFGWIERPGHRPWLITPDEPEAFVRALST